uniref:Uncharacterized protein n=1 Tax=Arundo donax TaxID=35708 RepID=A0A0A9EX61_ARUDO
MATPASGGALGRRRGGETRLSCASKVARCGRSLPLGELGGEEPPNREWQAQIELLPHRIELLHARI